MYLVRDVEAGLQSRGYFGSTLREQMAKEVQA